MSEAVAYHPRSFAKWIRERAEERRWINWRPDGKPIHPRTGKVGDCDPSDPSTWCTLDEALARDAYRIGIAITRDDPLGFIDFDWKHSDPPEPSEVQERTMEELRDLAWWETSRSGKGAHALVYLDKSRLPKKPRTKGPGVEVYLQDRFCYLTFEKMKGEPVKVQLEDWFPFIMEAQDEAKVIDVDFDGEPNIKLAKEALSGNSRLARLVEGDLEGEISRDRSDYDWAIAQQCKRIGLGFPEFRWILEQNPERSQVGKNGIDIRRALTRTWGRSPDESPKEQFKDVEVAPTPEGEEAEENEEVWVDDMCAQDEFVEVYQRLDRSKAFLFVTTANSGEGFWRAWDGKVWKTPGIGQLKMDLVSFSQEQRMDLPIVVRRRMASHDFISGAEKFFRSHRETSLTEWDVDPWILNTPNGPVDLRTGKIKKPRAGRLLSKTTTVGPASGDCPRWRKFLRQVFDGDRSLISYIQTVIGYGLTGDVSEHALFFLFGSGGNGKSTLTKVLEIILGDYAWAASGKLLTATKMERHPTELMSLMGRRFVVANELPKSAAWDEELLKKLTGGDTITARGMRQDEMTFNPTHKLFISANNKPRFNQVDDAIRRRLHLIPFTVNLKERFPIEPKLVERLVAEEGGQILSWAIEGCLRWQVEGLIAPKVVDDATEDYLESQDSYARWFGEKCIVEECPASEWARTGDLFADWKQWCHGRNEHVGREAEFVEALRRRGLEAKKIKGRSAWKWVRLREDVEEA